MRYYELPRPLRPDGGLAIEHVGRVWQLKFIHATMDYERQAVVHAPHKPEHTHTTVYHIVIYNKGADAHFLLEGKAHATNQGALILCNPGQSHELLPVGAGRPAYSEVSFAFVDASDQPLVLQFHDLLAAFAGRPLKPLPTPLQTDARQESAIMALFSRLMDRLETDNPFSELAARLVVAELFVLLIQEFYSASETGNVAISGLAAAKAHIETRYREDITVPLLASMAHMSAGYFHRAFQREFGISPIAYQATLRIEAARNLLRFSHLPCKTIATHLGYCDVYHFSKVFQKATGHAPATFRTRETARRGGGTT